MKRYVKHIFCLSVFALMMSLFACKKNGTATDFRDALVGSYSCTVHQWTQYGGGPLATDTLRYRDSIIGSSTVWVSKESGSVTGIVVGNSTSSALVTPKDSAVVEYFEPPATFFAGFYDHGDSLVYSYGAINQWGNGSGTSYMGRKIH